MKFYQGNFFCKHRTQGVYNNQVQHHYPWDKESVPGKNRWQNYIPEIYPLAKALLMTKDTDEASAKAWEDRMSAFYGICEEVIVALEQDGKLSPSWAKSEAIEMLWTILSIQNWAQLTIECGWSTEQYISWMKILLIRTFVDKSRLQK